MSVKSYRYVVLLSQIFFFNLQDVSNQPEFKNEYIKEQVKCAVSLG